MMLFINLRTMAHAHRTPEFNDLEFKKQLEFLFSDFSSISTIKLHTEINGFSALKIEKAKYLHIYRIIQELLSNCRKHSNAENLYFNLLYVHPVFENII